MNMEGMLNKDKHIKSVQEVFVNGNSWVEIDFDCEFSRGEAIKRIQKKEGNWLRLIPVTDNESKNTRHKIRSKEEKFKSKKNATYKEKEENRKEISNEAEENPKQKSRSYNDKPEVTKEYNHNRQINLDCITIWDLPVNIDTKEIRYICKKLDNIEDMYIKRSAIEPWQ